MIQQMDFKNIISSAQLSREITFFKKIPQAGSD